jgi:hypothetical protein
MLSSDHARLVYLYSLGKLTAYMLPQAEARVVRPAAWYAKMRTTFSDAPTVVRRKLWGPYHLAMSEAYRRR